MSIRTSLPSYFTGGAALLAASVALANQDAVQLPDVTVVSATGFEQKIADAPASISVISREQLQSKPYAGLADALRDVEGVDVGADLDKNGNISITMRGLPKDYTLVLIDGRRQSDIGDIGPNNFGNSQFMYMPSMDAIERIEVIRGPMSTLYGADAMGGVINIITRKVQDNWGGSISHALSIQENSQFGDDKKTDLFASGPLIEGLLGLGLRASLYDREQSDPGYSVGTLINGDGSLFEDGGSFGDKKIVAAKNWNAGFTLNLTPLEDHDFQFEYDIAKQRYDNTEGQTGTLDSVDSLWRARGGIIQPRVGYAENQRVEREQFVLAHTGRWSFGTSDTSLTRSTSSNLGRSLPLTVQERGALQDIWNQASADQGVGTPELTDELRAELENTFLPRNRRELEIRNTIFDTKLSSSIGSHHFTLGGQYFLAEMEDGVFGMDGSAYQSGATQDHKQWALFAEDNWDLTEKLTFTYGARYDDHNIFGAEVSPRGYLTWRTTDNWTLKGGVSTGYKTPKPNQLFPGIVGFGGQGVNPMAGSPDLQPETSTNYEIAAYYDNLTNFNANATLFFNEFKDKIARADAIPNCYNASGVKYLSSGCVDVGPGWAELGYDSFSQSTNVDKAQTKGIELAARWEIIPTLSLSGNYTYTDSEQKSGAQKGLPLVNTPEHMLNGTLSWDVLPRLNVALIAELRDERYRGTAVSAGPTPVTRKLYYKSYDIYHLGMRFQASNDLTLHGRVNNLLDKDMAGRNCEPTFDDLGNHDTWSCSNDYNVTEKARSLWLSANYRF
ncbi:outer membrane receptor for ferrienterochelin and colicins [Halopseudomonas litoralis]|uniref:Outer membrane receptor for ferrienterochelin and colicins n=1 Tax=Halopseudomonas litoralis TaxID=797277 RepID=A0A1H1RAV7_9GAMM|nr:TonB-dependent receptor [Halopseudomonas litoralis]SDS32029.1 outer membrane receptor for ferrienterochelin and colicins [Halopseudomonas litoralis]